MPAMLSATLDNLLNRGLPRSVRARWLRSGISAGA